LQQQYLAFVPFETQDMSLKSPDPTGNGIQMPHITFTPQKAQSN
jgi:hypothetical protein